MKISDKRMSVYLSTISLDDVDGMTENANNERVARGAGPHIPYPYNREDAMHFIEFATVGMREGREMHFGIHLADKAQIIGVIGLHFIDSVNKKCEVVYWLGEGYWGKGFGKDALRLILHYAFRRLKLERVYATILPSNIRSIGLANSLGFKKEGVLRNDMLVNGRFDDTELFGILSEEYNDSINPEISD